MDHLGCGQSLGWVKKRFWTYLDVFQTAVPYGMWRFLWPWPLGGLLSESFQEFFQRSDPLNERTPKKTWVSNSSSNIQQLTERGPLGFGPIHFLMESWWRLGSAVCCRHPLAISWAKAVFQVVKNWKRPENLQIASCLGLYLTWCHTNIN